MEEWCAKIEGLLQTSLKADEELKVLQTSTTAELENKMTKINQKLAESDNMLKNIQVESDDMIARNMKFCEELQPLKDKQRSELQHVRETLEEERRSIEKYENSLEKIRNVFVVLNDRGKVFNYPPVNFTLANFHELKDNNEIWYSPCFYSHNCGYKLQLQVYPNGDGRGRGTHVSVKLALMPGEFDDLLNWPFRGIVTIHLLNQRRDLNHIVHEVSLTNLETLYMREKPVVDEGELEDAHRIGEGEEKFIAHADLGEKTGFFRADKQFLKNDSLYFCVWNVHVFCQHH